MSRTPLVVDVDGTLLSTDLLWEGWVRALFESPLAAAASVGALASGRAAFKERVAEAVGLPVGDLPLDSGVLELIRAARDQGRPVVLASGAHREQVVALARRVGADEALGSEGDVNLTGRAKLERLEGRYAAFDYVGDGVGDLPLLEAARRGYLVDPSWWTRLLASGGEQEVEVLDGDRPPTWRALLRAARPHQWAKNALLLLPIAAAHLAPTPELALEVAVGLLALSLAASGVYLINDLADLAEDRRHPEKRKRPLAAGHLSIPGGVAAAAFCVVGSLALSWTRPPAFAGCVAAYLALSLAYSWRLKERLLLDVIVLAALYTVRVVAGAALVEIPLTDWFLAFSVFLFLSLALLKRVVELDGSDAGDEVRVPGRAYRPSDAPLLRAAGVGSGLMSAVIYCLYIAGPQAEELYAHPALLWAGLPLFLYWLVRVWLLADRGMVDEDPVAWVLADRASYFVLAAFLGVVLLAA